MATQHHRPEVKGPDTAIKDSLILYSHLAQLRKKDISQGHKDPGVELKTAPAGLIPAMNSCQSNFPGHAFLVVCSHGHTCPHMAFWHQMPKTTPWQATSIYISVSQKKKKKKSLERVNIPIICLFFKTGFLCVSLAVLELTL